MLNGPIRNFMKLKQIMINRLIMRQQISK